jgi:hypothetical protein
MGQGDDPSGVGASVYLDFNPFEIIIQAAG